MAPLESSSLAKLAFPMTRLARMRPATPTRTGSASNASALFSPYAVDRAAARALRRKSLGKGLPRSRSFASFARRSAIRWFSSPGAPPSLSVILKSLFQTGLHELVQGAVEDRRGVADLDPGAQILDARLVQDIAADLIAPAHVRIGMLEHFSSRVALIELELVKFCLQHLHRRRPVLVLAALA